LPRHRARDLAPLDPSPPYRFLGTRAARRPSLLRHQRFPDHDAAHSRAEEHREHLAGRLLSAPKSPNLPPLLRRSRALRRACSRHASELADARTLSRKRGLLRDVHGKLVRRFRRAPSGDLRLRLVALYGRAVLRILGARDAGLPPPPRT